MNYAELQNAIKEALKAHDKPRLSILRQVHGEVKNIEVNERREVTEQDVNDMLKRVIRRRRRSTAPSRPATTRSARTC